MSKICEWFHSNDFTANQQFCRKFYFLLSPFVDRPIKIMGSTIRSENR